jgi:hypothetical protein
VAATRTDVLTRRTRRVQPEHLITLKLPRNASGRATSRLGVRFRQRGDDQVVTSLASASSTRSRAPGITTSARLGISKEGMGCQRESAVADGIARQSTTRRSGPRVSPVIGRRGAHASAGSRPRSDERIHDPTASVESVLAPTSTRPFVSG